MNTICPRCNSFDQSEVRCHKCQTAMDDLGKAVDYLDEYSPYEEISTLKLVDGLQQSIARHECLHLFYCPKCGRERPIVIEEQRFG